MSYAPGDHVHVAALGKGTIREVRNGGRYLVEIKGRAIVVGHAQLAPLDARKPRPGGPGAPGVPEPLARAHVPATLDLHGYTSDEAVSALDSFLSDAILGGLAEVRVIHGRSGGRVKAAVHARLKQMTSIAGYRIDPRNAGVTIVAL